MPRFRILLALSVALLQLAAQAIDLVVETRTFHIPGIGPRVEVNMAMIQGTFLPEEGADRARVEVTTLIEQDSTIVQFAKTVVEGPVNADMLHQEFFDLKPGRYEVVVEARALARLDDAPVRYRAPLAVGALTEGISVSNFLFAERFDPAQPGEVSKYGYHAVPLLSDHFPAELKELNFYTEVYGTDAVLGLDSLYLLTYQIETTEHKRVVHPYKRLVRAKGRAVEPVLGSFDISALPTGDYLVAVEVRDRRGDLIARRDQRFQRYNPVVVRYDPRSLGELDLTASFVAQVNDRDTLVEYLRCLIPIADPLERKIIEDRWGDRDIDLMKRFFHSFWANRSITPEQAWREYHAQVVKVNQLFGCRVLRGYETDRGRIYLKYGAPNSMMDRFNEMDALPYTIWHYYRAGRYSNRRFVFYQPDLANNCMELIHSEVPGEISNPRWNQIIHGRNNAFQHVDPMPVEQMSGERAREFYDMPR